MTNTMFRTFSGVRLDVSDPDPSLIKIDDVLHALSLENRYNGHTSGPYSVGQHTLAMLWVLEDAGAPISARQAGFIHDTPEFILKDVAKPVRNAMGDSEYERLTEIWEDAICEAFAPFDGDMFREMYGKFISKIDFELYEAESRLICQDTSKPFPPNIYSIPIHTAANVPPEHIRIQLRQKYQELFT